jgi:hypothetical protein
MTKNNNKSVLVALLLAPLLTAGFTVGNIPQAEALPDIMPFEVSLECENTSPNTILWTFLITNMGDVPSTFDFHIVLETSDEVFFDAGTDVDVDNGETVEITIESDEGPSVYTGTFTVTNQSGVVHSATATCETGAAEDQIQATIENVDALNDPDLNNGNINSLNKKLENAIKNITNEDPTDDAEACEKLQSFIDQLNAFVNSEKLDQGQIDPLVDTAQSLIDDLCTPG